MRYSSYIKIFTAVFGAGLLLYAMIIVLVDPMFHYHSPIPGFSYILNNERYQNNGIVRHFEYDALITGTSMAENTNASEVDELFSVNSVKTCFSGAQYKEISDNINVALDNNPDLRMVFRAADLYRLYPGDDTDSYYECPLYLYDDNPFNDIQYVLNCDIMEYVRQEAVRTYNGIPGTSFDDYSSWNDGFEFGKDAVLANIVRPEQSDVNHEITDEEISSITENLENNIILPARKHPEVTFYIWIPPYSMLYFDDRKRNGYLERDLDALELEFKLLTDVSNIKLFCFADKKEIVKDLSHYKDNRHSSTEINTRIIRYIKNGEGQITGENYREYMKSLRDYYMNFDYDSLYE